MNIYVASADSIYLSDTSCFRRYSNIQVDETGIAKATDCS